jgi:phytol kinase
MDIAGLAVSYLFVGLVLALTLLLQKKLSVKPFYTRKIVHISVSNWWFILLAFFTRLGTAVIGPVSFIILNYLSYRHHLIPSMELSDNRKNLGTVYFPISLLLLVILGFTEVIPLEAGGIGILVLGYGDGSAALIGKRFGKRKRHLPGGEKSLAGTAAMVTVSFFAVLLLSALWFPGSMTAGRAVAAAAATAVGAALIELLTPWGIDNLTIPLGASVLFMAVSGV